VNRRRLIGAALVFSCACTPVAQAQTTTPITNTNIGTAATAWATNPATAATTYGNIADWNTAAVTSMYTLFHNQPTFNADIGKWNVASVSNMAGMFSGLPVARSLTHSLATPFSRAFVPMCARALCASAEETKGPNTER
jgi:hypothetical protein